MIEASNAGLHGAHEAMSSQKIGQQRQIHEIESQVFSLSLSLSLSRSLSPSLGLSLGLSFCLSLCLSLSVRV